MEQKYCKLKGTNNIFEVVEINKDLVTLKNQNKILHTTIQNIQYVEKTQNRNIANKSYNITIQD